METARGVPSTCHYLVSLSFAEERRELVAAVAERLAAALGRERVFFYPYHAAEVARPNLDLFLQSLYHDRSRLIVVFIDQHYATKRWCGIEWRAIRDLLESERSGQIMLVRLADAQVPGLFPLDGYVEARQLGPAEIAGLILERLHRQEEPRETPGPLEARLTRPGLLRFLLDRAAPRLHHALTRMGSFPEPPELAVLDAWLAHLQARIENEIREKTYLPLRARTLSPAGRTDETVQDAFARFVHLRIRQVLGREEGGDAATAQIAAVHRKSRLVRDLVRALLHSPDPLVLLGDPGSGKTMTLQEAALTLLRRERRRVFPTVLLTVRLGEFHVEGPVGSPEVLAFVKRSAPARLRPWIDDLDRQGRLVLLFDGMDEMSRERYTEHTAALSVFADEHRPGTRTLFSCRITDFSPALKHRRLVLLPFDQAQILRFLRLYLPARTVEIDRRAWSLSRLARRLAAGELPVDTGNPFVLWLLCLYLQERHTWPASRVELLSFFQTESYERKRRDAEAEGHLLPPAAEAFRAWAHLAFLLTERNRGSALPVSVLLDGADPAGIRSILSMIHAGKRCGVLAESLQGTEYQVRFEHHRFQEYFAALFIHQEQPAISWLDKLDAPRWQETMLNLVLLGGAEDGVRALTRAIKSELRAFRKSLVEYDARMEERKKPVRVVVVQPPPGDRTGDGEAEVSPVEPAEPAGTDDAAPILYGREAVLADRVELGARLLRQGGKTSPAVRKRLRPCLQEAVELLADRGRPITQVKMMRACQHLADVDLLRVLLKPLRSPVQWVRDQALILVANPPPGQPGTSDPATELGVDLGTGTLLRRWSVYFRMAVARRSPQLWMSFLLATFCGLAELALLLAAGWGLFEGLPRLAALWRPEWKEPAIRLAVLSPAVHGGLQGLITLAAAALAFRFHSGRLWAWVLGSIPLGSTLILSGSVLWEGRIQVLDFLLAAGRFAVFGGILGIVLLGAVARLGPLAAYGMATRKWRSTEVGTSALLRLAWQDASFGFASLLGLVLGLCGLLYLLLVWLDERASSLFDRFWSWLTGLVGVSGEQAEIALAVVVGAAVALWAVGKLVATLRERSFRELLSDTLKILKELLAGCLPFGATLVVLGVLFHFDVYVLRTLVVVAVLGLGGLFLWELVWLIRKNLALSRDLPPGLQSREAWKQAIEKAGARRQEDLLRRTHHQSLGLQPAEYLALLLEIEPLIKKDPALSTYWDHRDQLEQALRQERQG